MSKDREKSLPLLFVSQLAAANVNGLNFSDLKCQRNKLMNCPGRKKLEKILKKRLTFSRDCAIIIPERERNKRKRGNENERTLQSGIHEQR